MRALNLQIYLVALIFLVVTAVGHWRLVPTWDILFYVLGAVIGLHLIELLEGFLFNGFVASPLKTMFVYVLLVVLMFFVVSSTRNLIGSGVVLFLHLRYVFWMWDDFSKGSLGKWFTGGLIQRAQAQWWVWGATVIQGIGGLLFVLI